MKHRHKHKLRQKLLGRMEKRWIGFHVYRSTDENLPFVFWTRLTDDPIPEGNFDDPAASPGTRYYYKLTRVDSEGSESAPITPQSTFTDHGGTASDQNPLVDFAGYNMYRSADESVPLDQWERRNKKPLPTTEYIDEGVKSGEIYFYYLRAVDSRGTESAPSEILRVIRK